MAEILEFGARRFWPARPGEENSTSRRAAGLEGRQTLGDSNVRKYAKLFAGHDTSFMISNRGSGKSLTLLSGHFLTAASRIGFEATAEVKRILDSKEQGASANRIAPCI
jgi:hypothetical protein